MEKRYEKWLLLYAVVCVGCSDKSDEPDTAITFSSASRPNAPLTTLLQICYSYI